MVKQECSSEHFRSLLLRVSDFYIGGSRMQLV